MTQGDFTRWISFLSWIKNIFRQVIWKFLFLAWSFETLIISFLSIILFMRQFIDQEQTRCCESPQISGLRKSPTYWLSASDRLNLFNPYFSTLSRYQYVQYLDCSHIHNLLVHLNKMFSLEKLYRVGWRESLKSSFRLIKP